ncbi:peptidoglycan DD-metalloendopeptidase family protein [Streptomyces sp. LP05-1]|uniref:Peptidoglycan DD-metalloendopeptidase family protein n=1 Tax=Streptomyces pyxinae TaxID=2970734 RepID=A0ABT2CD12_9ACTN|nr:peptidoglycan DD-metalloendopeptidase family protein [Streptomyces sp. LP05-1]MCS0635012.1 peptidoglycan DD-metalloendopeptidase family protein [Streptomyces sp. LP05-1]
MVAPAVLQAAARAAQVAKAAKAARGQSGSPAGGGGDGDHTGDGPGRKKSARTWLLVVGLGGALPAAGTGVLVMVLLSSMVGGLGTGATRAACGDYGDNAQAGNTGDAAATSPIMPAGKVYLPSETARHEIPPRMILAAMRAAARYDGLDWTLIAGQMYQETKFGQDPSAAPGGRNSAGYMGLLQFGHPAWKDYGADGNGDGEKDLYNIDDAAFAAANYLHAEKAESNAWKALMRYSGSASANTIYMRVVLTQAARYRGTLTGDQGLIKDWYAHLRKTVDANPGFPALGRQSDIPEPVGNGAEPNRALSIHASPARDWSTPPLDGGSDGADGGRDTTRTTAMAPTAYALPTASSAYALPASPALPASLALPASPAFPMAPAAPAPDDGPAGSTGGKDWQWPLKRGTYQLGTKYHKQGGMWSLGYHTGLDLVAPSGTPIYAPADGKVVKAGPGGSYGNETNLRHAGGVITLYAHQTSIKVSVGDTVKRGQQIGTVGATGNVTGPHLHWEVRVPGVDNPFIGGQDKGPGMVDPEGWLAGKISANPDYGTVPGGTDQGRDAQYAGCAEQGNGAPVAPDGAGVTGVLPDADDPVVRAALGWAQRGLGVPYVLGAPRLQGVNPTTFDCSSYTQWIYYQASGGKMDIGSTTFDQEPNLRRYKVDLSEARPGDLIFFRPSGRGSEHVGMVWDPGTKKIVHAPRPGKNTEFSTWDVQDKITGVYRVPIPAGTDPTEADGTHRRA